MIDRQIFEVAAGTGAWVDTGISFMGEIAQLRWNPLSGDTGQNATMVISLLPRRGDTGDGFLIANYANLAADFTRAPRQYTHDLTGASDVTDTGTPAAPAPYAAAGDRLRVVVAGGPVSGRLYIWSKN